LPEGFGHFVTSMTAPVASGGSEFAGWDLHPLESAAFARRTSIAEVPVLSRRHIRGVGYWIYKRKQMDKPPHACR
ncbi:MAG: hypothetical protein WBX25_09865, partial [Rhodomicrobium sp.]